MRPSLTLCVFIDALGWEAMRGRSFLEGELSVRAPLASVLGYSCACCPTILTGRMPREHGHLAFYAYHPQATTFRGLDWLGYLPSAWTSRGRVRRWMSKGVAWLRSFDGYFQLYDMPLQRLRYFDYTEQRDIYRPGGIRTGVPTVFDALRERGVPYHVSNWRRSETECLRAAWRALDQGEVRFAYVYLAALDGLLHAQGPSGSHLDAALERYEQAVRHLLEVARRRYHSVELHLFSDHGMTAVHEHCNLMAAIEALGLRFGQDYVAMYDSTMARFWFLKPHARDAILAALHSEPRGRVATQGELEAWSCDFADARYGETFFLLEPGVLLCPSYMGRTGVAGMHGYDPHHPLATACYFSNASPARVPRRLDDLYAVMLESTLSSATGAEPSRKGQSHGSQP